MVWEYLRHLSDEFLTSRRVKIQKSVLESRSSNFDDLFFALCVHQTCRYVTSLEIGLYLESSNLTFSIIFTHLKLENLI